MEWTRADLNLLIYVTTQQTGHQEGIPHGLKLETLSACRSDTKKIRHLERILHGQELETL